jgi:hypothetical protein
MLWLTLTLKVASCLSRARVLSFAMQKPILRHQHESRRTHGYPPQPPPPPPPPPLPRSVSARELYPVFLSFQDTLALQVGWAWRGLVDAFRWDIVVRLITRNVGFLSNNNSFCFFLLTTPWFVQRCRGPRSRAQVVHAEWHLRALHLCLRLFSAASCTRTTTAEVAAP